jgi:SPW repeat
MTRSLPRDPLPGIAAGLVGGSLIAPWALGFSSSHAAVAGHIAFALAFGPIALLITALPAAAVTTALAGAWPAASPWLLGYASHGAAAWAADLLAGASLVVVARRALRSGAPARRPASVPVRR